MLLEDLFNTSGNEKHIPSSTNVGRITRVPVIPRPSDNSQEIIPEVLVFLGAGASVPAGVPSVNQMVDRLLTYLLNENESEYCQILTEIVELLREWVKNERLDKMVDIELLLETVEKIENRGDILPLFYDNEKI